MPSEPIFQCSWLFTKMLVYPDRIEKIKPFGFGKFIIPAKKISTVAHSSLMGYAIVETSGGAAHRFNIGNRDNLTAFVEAVQSLIA